MLRQVKNLIMKDIVYTFRENVLLYVVVVPIVIALGFRLFVPSLENVELTFAVDPSVPGQLAGKLDDYAQVQGVSSRDALEQRVLQFDDVPGIYLSGDTYKVLLEGNEASYVRELPGVIIDRIEAGQEAVDISEVNLGRESSFVREYITIILVILCIVVGGMVMGYSIVHERETNSLDALAVTPLTTGGFLAAKSIVAVVTGTLLALATAMIVMGAGSLDYAGLLETTAASLPTGLIFGLLLGLLSANQLSAIALTKTLSIPYAVVPIAAVLAPGAYHWILYPFPNYWSFVALQRLLVNTDLPVHTPNLLALATSALFIALIVPAVARTIRV